LTNTNFQTLWFGYIVAPGIFHPTLGSTSSVDMGFYV